MSVTDEDIREMEWAATYLAAHPPRRGCRCAGSCEACRARAEQERKLGPAAIAELAREALRARAAEREVARG